MGTSRTLGGRRARRLIAAALGAALLLALAATAHAQLGDPGTQTLDTDVTPVAKESERWSWVAGAKYSSDGPKPSDVPEDSVTPFEADLFTVSFHEPGGGKPAENGFAAGAVCREPVPAGASPEEAREYTATCERVPVIYRYSVNDIGEASWEEVYRGTSPGYVGAIDWISEGRALAVGGTGSYPRRELRPSTPENDPAEDARAWLYENGSWRELTDLPEGMRGMNALDVSPRPSDCGPDVTSECAVAGGFRQLWMFEDGAFTGGVSEQSPDSELDRSYLFQFRVRDLRFAEDTRSGIGAVAATSGCCAADELQNGPRLLIYDGEQWYVRQREGDIRNASNAFHQQGAARSRPAEDAWQKVFKEPYGIPFFGLQNYEQIHGTAEGGCTVVVRICTKGIYQQGFSPAGIPLIPPLEPEFGPWPLDGILPEDPPENPAAEQTDPLDDTIERTHDEQHRELDRALSPYGSVGADSPESFYALTNATTTFDAAGHTAATVRLVATPGGPAPEGDQPSEPTSQVAIADVRIDRGSRFVSVPVVGRSKILPFASPSFLISSNADKLLSSLRLHDVDMTPVTMNGEAFGSGVESVGVLTQTGQGVAYGPQERFPDRSAAGLHGCNTSVTPPEDCDPDAERFVEAYESRNLHKLPSYSLNSVDIFDDPLDKGAGWAVGDHGAILSLAGRSAAQAQAAEPAPPTLGSRKAGPLPDSSAYDARRQPPTDKPGVVPSLAARPLERLRAPRLVNGGTPTGVGQVDSIAMSRDGGEGWAFGRNGSQRTIHHFDGAEWRPCDPEDPDLAVEEACASFAPYRDFEITDVERVPLERDSDPSNDDAFEAAALTKTNGLLRYRAGRWSLDEEARARPFAGASPQPLGGTDIAFTAPDDGWVAVGGNFVDHFNGERWMRCKGREVDSDCDDPDRRLSAPVEQVLPGQTSTGNRNARGLRFAVAGERVYAFGTRRVGLDAGGGTDLVSESYPMIVYRDLGGTWTGGIDETDDGAYNPTDGGWDPGFYASGEAQERIVEPPDVHNLVNPWLNTGATAVNAAARRAGQGGDQGRVFTVSVAETEDGFEGWALGLFGGLDSNADAAMMRLRGGGWRSWSNGDAIDEYLRDLHPNDALDPRSHLTLPPQAGRHTSFLFQRPVVDRFPTPALAFNEERERWEALPTPWLAARLHRLTHARPTGIGAAAADGRGGFWLGVGGAFGFYHYTERIPKPVFENAPQPVGNTPVTAMAAAADGTLWLGDEEGTLYRYDRLTGWDRGVRVPGWDPPRSSTRSPIIALGVAPGGRGIAVGPGGRIAEIGPEEVRLDDAAGVACELAAPLPPCGTGRSLTAAAVAPDGSALLAGGSQTLLWRPAGGDFRRIEPPRLPHSTGFADLELPHPDHAYLLTDRNQVLRGELEGEEWTWRFELGSLTGPDPVASGINDFAVDANGHGYAVGNGGLMLERGGDDAAPWRRLKGGDRQDLQSVALPAGGGEGAVVGGDRGLILTLADRRFEVARLGDALDPVSSAFSSAFFGGREVPALALAPGVETGQIEAWALLHAPPASGIGNRSPAPQALLHYGSDPTEPLLNPTRGVHPLPDVSAPRPGELSFATFGKQECQTIRKDSFGFGERLSATATCPAANGSSLTNEVIAERVSKELLQRAERPGGPEFALFTGDAADAAGGGDSFVWAPGFPGSLDARMPIDPNSKHRRWVELVADPLAVGGLPLFGAIGGQDLALHSEFGYDPQTDLFFGGNLSARQLAEGAGVRGGVLNLPWRNTIGAMPAPWEREEEESASIGFERVGSPLDQEMPEAETPSTRATPQTGSKLRLNSISTAGAPTHYATDVIRDGERVARIVVADTSLGSLSASDAMQHPIAPGGQERWLEEVLCFEGSAADLDGDIRDCTREPGQLAIVLTNTPTYSYGPIAPDETMRDAAAFEAILLRNKVNVVVSGRLGWNGLYWATAPGVHEPCPGQPYQTEPPKPGTRVCGQGSAELTGASEEVQGDVSELADGTPVGTLPFVVSSTAGGRFNERAERSGATTAENGFWRGYSIVRLAADGDPAKTIVEQRPILDWVGLEAGERELEPRGTVRLEGYAREAFGLDTPARYIDIASPAITHRYDLLLADPEEPWLPCEASDAACVALRDKLAVGPRSLGSARDDSGGASSTDSGGASSTANDSGGAGDAPTLSSRAEASRSDAAAEGSGALAAVGAGGETCEPYLCLPERVGAVDSQSGELKAGNGKYPDTFAIGMLSVGDHVATYPLVFKRSPSFVVNPAVARPSVPEIGADAGLSPHTPPPPSVPKPNVPQPSLPELPALPGVPPLSAAQPPEPQPPAPPTPPPPTEQPSPLDLTVSPTALTVATPAAVIQPPTPPVNPAPPSGARREARQRQAAAQKSGADSVEQSEMQEMGGDLADGKPIAKGSAMTRRSPARADRHPATALGRTRPQPSFTPLTRPQPSAGAQGLLYGGGITMLAAVLALGFTTLRPGPRRRQPQLPAPAHCQARRLR